MYAVRVDLITINFQYHGTKEKSCEAKASSKEDSPKGCSEAKASCEEKDCSKAKASCEEEGSSKAKASSKEEGRKEDHEAKGYEAKIVFRRKITRGYTRVILC